MSKGPVKIVIIGPSGLIGVRHLEHVLAEPTVSLAALVDAAPAGKELATKHSVPYFTSIQELLDARSQGQLVVEAAILCTPTPSHVPLGIQLVEAGITTLVEKPLAVDGPSGYKLLKAAAGKATILTGHHRRFHPRARALRSALDAGQLGDVLAVTGVWAGYKPLSYYDIAWRRELGSGGPLLTNLIHEIDLLRYVMAQDIVQVHAMEGKKQRGFAVEETVAILFKFADGAVGTFLLSDAAATPYAWELATGENPLMPVSGETCYTFMGSKASMTIPQLTRFHQAPEVHTEKGWLAAYERDTSAASTIDDTPPFTLQLRHLAKVARSEEEPNCSGKQGLQAVLVLEAIFTSLKTKLPVDVEIIAMPNGA